jgi:hypothetical protein
VTGLRPIDDVVDLERGGGTERLALLVVLGDQLLVPLLAALLDVFVRHHGVLTGSPARRSVIRGAAGSATASTPGLAGGTGLPAQDE